VEPRKEERKKERQKEIGCEVEGKGKSEVAPVLN
jgi:hypothetical protein